MNFETEFHQRIKLFPCPHCKRIGSLILHGYIHGYNHSSLHREQKGHRILCNKRRKHKQGCGKTIACYCADYIPYLWYTLPSFWECICKLLTGTTITTAFCTLLRISTRTAYRLFTRFKHSQHTIRSKLLTIKDSPPSTASSSALIQTVLHLHEAFTGCDNPLIAYQLQFQVSVM
jgi:hypothetical protein